MMKTFIAFTNSTLFAFAVAYWDAEWAGYRAPTLTIYTDQETGCEYVTSPRGGLSIRLNVHGDPICGRIGP